MVRHPAQPRIKRMTNVMATPALMPTPDATTFNVVRKTDD
jgi:hypothetical protein